MTARDEFFHVMGANGVRFADACAFLRYATTLQRLAEVACCRSLTPNEQAREQRVVGLVAELCARHKLKVQFQGDPRGACVKLKLPGGQHNDFGGEGLYCVPANGYTAKQLERMGA